jgi:hypothetical protein
MSRVIRLHGVHAFEGGINDKPASTPVEINARLRQIRADRLVHNYRRLSGAASECYRENYAQGTFQSFHLVSACVVYFVVLYALLFLPRRSKYQLSS